MCWQKQKEVIKCGYRNNYERRNVMSNTKMNKIKEIVGACEKMNEADLSFILGYATGIAIKCESIKVKSN